MVIHCRLVAQFKCDRHSAATIFGHMAQALGKDLSPPRYLLAENMTSWLFLSPTSAASRAGLNAASKQASSNKGERKRSSAKCKNHLHDNEGGRDGFCVPRPPPNRSTTTRRLPPIAAGRTEIVPIRRRSIACRTTHSRPALGVGVSKVGGTARAALRRLGRGTR